MPGWLMSTAMAALAMIAFIAFGANLAIRGFRSKRWLLLLVGVVSVVVGAYFGVILYMVIGCWAGIGCI